MRHYHLQNDYPQDTRASQAGSPLRIFKEKQRLYLLIFRYTLDIIFRSQLWGIVIGEDHLFV